LSEAPKIGTIGWTDLTVPDADTLRDFYTSVTGWTSEPCEMGGYADYVMMSPATGQPVAGVCHARGTNAGIPPVWLIYITVEKLEVSMNRCVELGGKILVPPKAAGPGRYCVIQDPAGACAGLFEHAG